MLVIHKNKKKCVPEGKGNMRNFNFALIVLVLTYLIYVYPLGLLLHLLFATDIYHPSLLLLSCILSALIFLYLRTHLSSPLLRGITHYGLGIGFLGFCIFNTGLLASSVLPENRVEIGVLSLVTFLSVCGYSLIQGRSIKIKSLEFNSPKVARPHRLIFISDVHLGSNPSSHAEKICRLIRPLDFDYLLIGGDLFDSSSFVPDELHPFLDIKQPIYFVTGNHEYYVKDHRRKLEQLKRFKINTLDNQTQTIGSLNLIGISDNQHIRRQADIVCDLIDETKFNLLMIHQPSVWEAVSGSVDLMLSGHTHKGQIFPFNLFVRMQFKTVYGLFTAKGSHLYVSSGSGTWGPRMRLGTQNEIVKIAIRPR